LTWINAAGGGSGKTSRQRPQEDVMLAKDIMTTRCITVSPNTPVAEIARLLLDHHISAVPVLDGERLVGIVSEGDMIRRAELGTDTRRHAWWLEVLLDKNVLAGEFIKTHGKRARDVMTSPVITVTEDASVADIATTLERRHIKRVPVVRDGKLVGIVSRANLVQCIAASKGREVERPSASDEEIRRRLVESLEQQPWATVMTTSVFVSNGVVELWGFAQSEKEKAATRVAAEEIAGVREVVDHRAVRAVSAAGI
jgi:CBS domain-containing protein